MPKRFKYSNFGFRYCFGFRVLDFGFVMIALSPLLLTGCAKISHLDQLLTLKDLSDEQDRLERHIQTRDEKFEFLVKAVQDGTIGRYKNQKSLRRHFGEPVYTEKITQDGRLLDLWVYRYTTKFFDSPKVQLYLDSSGQLIRWDYLGASD